jgi:glycerophosphoryl diester phosphodiesterase
VASIGITDHNAWDYAAGCPTGLVQQAKDRGLLVNMWTFKDEQLFFGAGCPSKAYEIATKVLRLDGIITEFPDALAAIQPFLKP